MEHEVMFLMLSSLWVRVVTNIYRVSPSGSPDEAGVDASARLSTLAQ